MLFLFFGAFLSYGQTHFSLHTPIKYYKVKIIKSIETIEDPFEEDNLTTSHIGIIDLSGYTPLKNIKIKLQYKIKDGNDSCDILIYKGNKLLQKIVQLNPLWKLDDFAYLADIDGNKLPDIKFFIHNIASGLSADLSTKVYLFNMGDSFKKISFFDYANEPEYDLNKNGNYEILSRNHLYHKDGHSYWIYNAYNFSEKKLVNVSKQYNYPLWTKHLNRTDTVVAKHMSYEERSKEYKALPDSLDIR